MLIGVLSDTHDHLPNIRKAITIMIEHKVEKIIHCGDLVAPFIVRALTELKDKNIETLGVFGNNDGERDNMNRMLGGLLKIQGDFFDLELAGKKVAVYHGTVLQIVEALAHSQLYDLVLVGHTHQLRIEKIGKTLLVNPGELCGYLTGNETFAIIDLSVESKGELTEQSVNIVTLAKKNNP